MASGQDKTSVVACSNLWEGLGSRVPLGALPTGLPNSTQPAAAPPALTPETFPSNAEERALARLLPARAVTLVLMTFS